MEHWGKELSEELVAKAEGSGRKDGCQIQAKSMQARWTRRKRSRSDRGMLKKSKAALSAGRVRRVLRRQKKRASIFLSHAYTTVAVP